MEIKQRMSYGKLSVLERRVGVVKIERRGRRKQILGLRLQTRLVVVVEITDGRKVGKVIFAACCLKC